MDFKTPVARRVDLYRNRKNAGIQLKELLAYDHTLLTINNFIDCYNMYLNLSFLISSMT